MPRTWRANGYGICVFIFLRYNIVIIVNNIITWFSEKIWRALYSRRRRAAPTVWQHCVVDGASGSRRHQNPAVPKRARALATVAATADFIPTGRRAPSDPRPAQLRERIRAAHTFDDAPSTTTLTTPTTHSVGLLPPVLRVARFQYGVPSVAYYSCFALVSCLRERKCSRLKIINFSSSSSLTHVGKY